MKISTVIGARPQFIKAAMVSRALKSNSINEEILHTGQHFDTNMSQVFFDQMGIPEPAVDLKINGGSHGEMSGNMLIALERQFEMRKPNVVLIYGDTNSTLAASLAAAKLHIPIAHVEAGLRSFNMNMPEEVNRIVADRLSTHLYCPTRSAVDNLAAEGVRENVFLVGDVMYDAAIAFGQLAAEHSTITRQLNIHNEPFGLVTLHRQENTDDAKRLRNILETLANMTNDLPLLFPLHPRTRQAVARENLEHLLDAFILTDPLPFLDMVLLEKQAKLIFTDSGGVQKEAYFHGVPCITLRDETEWVETVHAGWNQVVGADPDAIKHAVSQANTGGSIAEYGDGSCAEKIATLLLDIH